MKFVIFNINANDCKITTEDNFYAYISDCNKYLDFEGSVDDAISYLRKYYNNCDIEIIR